MHTQCPHCQTVFNVTSDQLRLAHGTVRCGQCMNTFDGLQGLSGDDLEKHTTANFEPTQEQEPVATVEQHGDRALLRAIPKSQWTVAVPDVMPDDPVHEREYADTLAEPYSATLANVYPEIVPGVGARAQESSDEVAADQTTCETQTAQEAEADTRADEAPPDPDSGDVSREVSAAIAADPRTDEDAYEPAPEEGACDSETATVALGELPDERFNPARGEVNEEAIEQVGSIVPTLPTDASEDEIGEPIDIETLRSFEAQVEASMHGGPRYEPATGQERDESRVEQLQDEDMDLEPSYPQVLEDDIARLEGLAARARARKGLAVLSVCLLVALALQYAWFMPTDMASRYPQARSFLDTFCRYTACTLPEQRDPTLVQVVSRDVRVHPKYEGALLVTAQLVNAANFVQPYPLMEFTLFNVNGQTIATRTFTPEQYVGPSVDIGAGMTPTIPTQIELDVLAPDEAAISFEFRFL